MGDVRRDPATTTESETTVKHLVPILDEGVTLDRGDHVIVLLDALDRDEIQQEISAICALLAQSGTIKPQRTEDD